MNALFHIDPRTVADEGDELSIQVRLRKELKKRAPTCSLIAIPNGAQRTIWAAMKAKAEGMQAGFPDCMILWPNAGIAFAEIKAAGGALSDQQHIALNRLTKAGFNVGVFRSADTCLHWLLELGAPVDHAFMVEAAT